MDIRPPPPGTPSEKTAGLERKRIICLLLNKLHETEQRWADEVFRLQSIRNTKKYIASLEERPETNLPFLISLGKHMYEEMSLKYFCGLIAPLEREYASGNIIDNDFLVVSKDRPDKERSIMPVSVVLDNIRSAFNIGGIFRTSECAGIDKIFLCGYCATPENNKVRKSALGTEQVVSWKYFMEIDTILEKLKSEGVKIYALETVEEKPSHVETSYSFPCALVLGNERFGLGPSVLAQADQIICIPTYGIKNSLNVVSALSICAYEIRRQFKER